MQLASEAALASRDDLEQYGSNAHLLFALQLHEGIEDIHSIAADALTDHANDKKCDLVYIDEEQSVAIIAQGYYSAKQRAAAPCQKASDLSTATTWVLSPDLETLPIPLRSAAEQLQDALARNAIERLEIWYVHNLPESENVRRELDKVEEAAAALLARSYAKNKITPHTREIGAKTIERWYQRTRTPILVTESFSFETSGGFWEEGTSWKAYATSLPASWLAEQYKKHGKRLFTANVRDYLGSRKSDKNINHNIKTTASETPENFWAYNNGVTALVNEMRATSEDGSGLLEIEGIAIVNGAQTTGSLGSVADANALENARVQVRFIKCQDTATIQRIIQYNNSQNKVEAADFRSNDDHQRRLRDEFRQLKFVEYRGGRRGGEEDKIRRPRAEIPSASAGQALAAFHGKPGVAYNKKSEIWVSDRLYSEFFHPGTSAQHILFTFSLVRAIESWKSELRALSTDKMTEAQRRQRAFSDKRGSIYLLATAVAACLESILGRPIPNRFRLGFNKNVKSLDQAIETWQAILPRMAAFVHVLSPALARGNLRESDSNKTEKSLNDFQSLVSATIEQIPEQFSDFRAKTSS